MGRSDAGIYDSDAAFDFLSMITDVLKRELAYLTSPEQVISDGWWLAQMLTMIELILLFELQDIGSSFFISTEPETVLRWREIFLRVWDSDWKADNAYPYLYDEPEYRKTNRSAVMSLFDRMEKIAQFWTSQGGIEVLRELVRQPLETPLPNFSINCRVYQQNRAEVGVEYFTVEFIRRLEREIIYRLSPEKRAEILVTDTDELWVSVDVLRFLCKAYEQSIGVNEHIVRIWRDTTLQIGEQYRAECGEVGWDDGLRRNIEQAFDGLEAVAKKYPPPEW